MSKRPLVSVIVPAYNVEKYLAPCLDSILNQTFSDFEIIIIDDGSTDRTPEVISKYSLDPRIRSHTQQNSGISVARNQGLKMSRGQYLCYIDSDDLITKDYLEKLITPLLQNPEIDITVCGYQEIYQTHSFHHIPTPKISSGLQATQDFLIKQQDLDILIWNKMYRKNLFTDNHILYPAGQIHEDNLTTYKLFFAAKNIQYLEEELYFYQRRNSYITKNFTSTEKTLTRLKAKEQTAKEAKIYLRTPEFKLICNVSLILAYFAYIDNAITSHIDQKYYQEYREKTLRALMINQKNPYLTQKLRLYSVLLSTPKGFLYRIFRKITLKQV